MGAIWDIVVALVGIATSGTAYLARIAALRPRPTTTLGEDPIVAALKDYGRSLVRLAKYAIAVPLPGFIIGIATNTRWLTSLSGIWCSLWLLVIFAVSSPLGILIEAITGGIKGSSKRYVAFVQEILSLELSMALIFSLVPIRNNPKLIPIALVAAAVVVMHAVFNGGAGRFKKIMNKVAIAALIFSVLAFYFTWIPAGAEKIIQKANDYGNCMVQTGHLPAVQAVTAPESKIEPVVVDAGKDKPLVFVAGGTYHTFQANHPWILIYDGTKEKRMEAGPSWWKGAGSGGYIGAKGIKDGTVIEIERRQS